MAYYGYSCPTTGFTVRIVSYSLRPFGAIVESFPYCQIDYECSRGSECADRISLECEVRQRNEGFGVQRNEKSS